MTVLYIREQGAMVRREVEQIRVTKSKEGGRQVTTLQEISIRELEQVVLYGNVQLTTQAAALLLEHEVDIVFLSERGNYRGRLSKDGSKFAKLRHAQLRLSSDDKRSLAVAKALVRTKLANQRNLLQEWATLMAGQGPAGDQITAQLQEAARHIDRMRVETIRAQDPDSLRGYEGRAGATYFGAMRLLLEPAWGFQTRAYYPPPDAFNALLSFGYALLLKDITATLHLVGLDPYIGCFHALEYNRPSLALDLMEEFRPLVVDRTMIALALTKQLQPDQFTYTGRAERPVEVGEEQLPLVIKAYEARLEESVLHRPTDAQQKLRRCFELQARSYARVVLETGRLYEGVIA
ncbi:MAG: CRISPR-associated endonuclease Cas1 [Caldilineaceae bacterium]